MKSDIDKYKRRIKNEVLNKRLTNIAILKLISTIDDSANVNPKANKDDIIEILCSDSYLNDTTKLQIICVELGIEQPKKKYRRFIEVISRPDICVGIVGVLLGLGFAIFSDHHIINKDETNKTEIIDKIDNLEKKVNKINDVLDIKKDELSKLKITDEEVSSIQKMFIAGIDSDFINHFASIGVISQPKAKSAIFNMFGNRFFYEKKYKLAIKCYNNAISLDEENYIAIANKAIVLFNEGKIEEAFTSFNKAIEIKNNVSDLYLLRGLAFERIDSIKLAKLDFEKATKYYQSPNLNKPPIKNIVTERFMELEKKIYSQNLPSIAERIDKEYAFMYLILARDFYLKGHFDEALEFCNKAIEFDSQNADIYTIRSRCFAIVGKSREAESDSLFAKALKAHSNN